MVVNWSAVEAVSCGISTLATIGLLWVARVGFQQLAVSKKDIALRSKRDAIACAIAQGRYFADHIIPENGRVMHLLAAGEVPLFTQTAEELKFDPSNKAEVKRADEWVSKLPPQAYSACVVLLNHLEAFAMNFTTRLADSEVGFGPTSDVYCRTVVHLYPLVLHLRALRDGTLYPNLVKLYGDWAGKKTQAQREKQVRELQNKLDELGDAQLSSDHPPPLGAD